MLSNAFKGLLVCREVDLGRFRLSRSEAAQLRSFLAAENRWPERPRQLRPKAEAYFEKMSRVGEALMEVGRGFRSLKNAVKRRWLWPCSSRSTSFRAKRIGASGVHASSAIPELTPRAAGNIQTMAAGHYWHRYGRGSSDGRQWCCECNVYCSSAGVTSSPPSESS